MKTYSQFLLSLLFFSTTNAFSQVYPKVYVKGTNCSNQNDGNCFYNLEPSGGLNSPTFHYYVPVVEFPNGSVVPPNATQTYTWTIAGGSATSTTTQQVGVKWSNTPNYNNGSPTKTIRVKVKFVWDDGVKEITSILPSGADSPHPIEVRYISTPSSVSFNGSTVGNNSSLSFPCGATSKTISVPAVTTEPYGVPVTYYFSFPSGWSAPITSSSPSANVYANINSGGSILIEAKRNDSNFRTIIDINITRPLPSISALSVGDRTFCNSSDQITVSATGSNADKFRWSPSGGVKVNGSTSSQTVSGSVTISASSAGGYGVQAYSTACQALSSNSVSRNVYYGPPVNITGTVNGQTQQTPNYVPNGAFLVLKSPPGIYTSYNWAILQGNGYLYPGSSNSANATPSPFIRVEGKVYNACGYGSTTFYLSNEQQPYYYAMAPNPSGADEASIIFKENSAGAALAKSAVIYNGKQEKVREYDFTTQRRNKSSKSNEFKMDLRGLSPGEYYVHVTVGDEVEKQKLLVK